MPRAVVPIALYIAAGVAFVIAVNADQQNFDIPAAAIGASAILVGWATGNAGLRGLYVWLLLPCVLVLLGLPFATTEKFTGGDDLSLVWLIVIWPALASMLLMVLAAGARRLYDRYDRHRPGASGRLSN